MKIHEYKKTRRKIFFKHNKLNFFISILSAVLVSLTKLSIAWILQNVIDYISKSSNHSFLEIVIATIITFTVLGGAIIIDYFFSPKFVSKAIENYKNFMFESLLKKQNDDFYNENTATYISLLNNDIERIKKDYLDQIQAFVEIVLTLIGAVTMMFLSNPLLAGLSLFISTFPLLFSVFMGKKISEKEKILSQRNAEYTSFVKDALAGYSVIKSFKAEEKVCENHEDCNHNQIHSLIKREQSIIAVNSTSHFLGNITQISIFLICAALTSKFTSITSGTVVLFIQLMNSVIRPIEQLPKIIVARKGILSIVEKHFSLIDKKSGNNCKSVLCDNDFNISIKSLGYSYDGSKKAIKDISLIFESGKSYLIVGESGSGKTTLVNLLTGALDGYEGNIKYGDKEINNISLDSLYDNVSIIQQNVYIFNDSIKNNITMYGLFDDSDVERAISLAGLNDVVSEKGIDYICGENGNQLSGGEKQRISIARCILRKQKIIFIDEGTSSLDVETTKKINKSILALEDTTRIIISHQIDFELVRSCDQIIAMKNGEIIEKGTFDELMKNNSYFSALFLLATN